MTMRPSLSIVMPTKDRPQLLRRAVDTALAQSIGAEVEVIVVDDGSREPVRLAQDPRMRVIRSPTSRGGAGARNAGTVEARAPHVAYLDDDDELHPHFAEVSLEAQGTSELPPPVGVLSALEAVDADGRVLEIKRPQGAVRGAPYALQDLDPERSFHAKQTLVVGRDVLLEAGGWNPAFRSRVHTELFLRLGRSCSFEALDTVTYRLLVHAGPRVSKDPRLRQQSFAQLVEEHAEALRDHPRGAARLHVDHAQQSWTDRQHAIAVRSAMRAVGLAPNYALRELAGRARHRLANRD